MAVTIDSTVGGASANSFVTLAEANTHIEGRLNASTWETDATTDNKNRALVEAARELTTLRWNGRKASDTQALAWPRDLAVDPDSPNAWFFANTEIPQRVKDAQMELAFQFIKSGTTDIAALPSDAELISKTVDVLSWTYAPPGVRRQGLRRFPRVWNAISPLLEATGNAVVRG